MNSLPDIVPLAYAISGATPHSGIYRPENILVDKPQDAASRWSGALQGSNQFIVLRLETLSVLIDFVWQGNSPNVNAIPKPKCLLCLLDIRLAHPCNVKEVKVFVGVDQDDMIEVLHVSLKNDAIPETFHIQHNRHSEVDFPTRYVKIMPLSAHGHGKYNTSIWHIALHGIADTHHVACVQDAFEEYRESVILRHILKHLRQRRLLTPFQNILQRTNIRLEHHLVTQLHERLVLKGNWSRSEQLIDEIATSGLFSEYLLSHQLRAMWKRLPGTDAAGRMPPARGGHAMCIDPENEVIYLFGGWTGEKSLDDFWAYSIREDSWRCLSQSTAQDQNAPGPRSCHKMVFDTKSGSIYILGRLNDTDNIQPPPSQYPRAVNPQTGPAPPTPAQVIPQQPQQPPQPPIGTPLAHSETSNDTPPKTYLSEFYRYHTRGLDAGRWDFLSFDTAASGGPPLVFDHQMVMDSDAQMIYIFGGRILNDALEPNKYGGFYSYDVRTSRWTNLQPSDSPPRGSEIIIPPRSGHSMVLDPISKTLYIFAGQRKEEYLSDMYAYDINTRVTTQLFSNFTAAGGPEASFMQRAVIDPRQKEIYVFCGLTRTFPSVGQNTLRGYFSNWTYRYEKSPGKWHHIVHPPETPLHQMPVPRFAHQVVYNPSTRTVFIHGGNAGGPTAFDPSKTLHLGGRNADGDFGGNATTSATDSEEQDGKAKGMRLDDFWKMELKRSTPGQIIKQAKFLIRRQQFKEMCQDPNPVKALGFLKTKVYEVVDHSSPKETETFRALLTHLLSPPTPKSLSPRVSPAEPSSHDYPWPASTGGEPSPLNHDIRSRKRSRSDIEDDEGSGEWTNEIPRLHSVSDRGASSPGMNRPSGTIERIKDMTDSYELTLDSASTAAHIGSEQSQDHDGASDIMMTSDGRLSGETYTQRTEVFEDLLKFISEEAKQPQQNLLDLVEGDSWSKPGR